MNAGRRRSIRNELQRTLLNPRLRAAKPPPRVRIPHSPPNFPNKNFGRASSVPCQRYSASYPGRRIRAVIDVLGRLNAIDESLVDTGKTECGNRAHELGGACDIGSRVETFPRRIPRIAKTRQRVNRHPVQERGHVEERMADAAVAPVEEHKSLAVGPVVSWMEVTVDERVHEAAFIERLQPGWHFAYKLIQGGLLTQFEVRPEVVASREARRLVNKCRPAPILASGRKDGVAA